MTGPHSRTPRNGSPDATLLQAFLADRDVVCPNCGHNLRGSTRPSCPECGDPIALTITNYPSFGRGYRIGLLGLAVSAVLSLVLAAQVLRTSPVLSVLAVAITFWSAAAIRRWRRNRALYASLLRHKRQERVVACWIGAIILGVLVAANAVTEP